MYKKTLDEGHGRIEKREYFLRNRIDWLEQKTAWSNLRAIGMFRSTVERSGKMHVDTRYYISSLTNIDDFAYAVKKTLVDRKSIALVSGCCVF